MHDELSDHRIEGSVRERQKFGRCHFDGDAGQSLSGGVDERLGWVDGSHASRPQSANQLGRERPRSAADIEDALGIGNVGEGSNLRSEKG